MKKSFLLLIVVLLVSALALTSASAQVKKGESVITAGLGVGYPGAYGTGGLPIFAAFETAVVPQISVGGILSYAGSSEDFGYVEYSYKYIFVGARGAYHFGPIIHNFPKNLDLYAGLTLGYNITSNSAKYDGPSDLRDYYTRLYSDQSGWFGFGPFGGARYYFSPNFAVTGEVGYDIAYLKIGASYKF